MEYQYTTVDTEIGTFTLIRVFTTHDAELAIGEHFREYFAEEMGDEDLVTVYRDENGSYEWYGTIPLEVSDPELDAMVWEEGEWWP